MWQLMNLLVLLKWSFITCYRQSQSYQSDICRFRAMTLSPLHLAVNCPVFIRLESRLRSNVGFSLTGNLAVFTRSSIKNEPIWMKPRALFDRVDLRQRSSDHPPHVTEDMVVFRFFKMAAVRHLGFVIHLFGQTTNSIWWSLSLCKICGIGVIVSVLRKF